MKAQITISLLLSTVLAWCAFADTAQGPWGRDDLSSGERSELVASAKQEPFEKVAPVLLKVLASCQPSYGINPVGTMPWNDDRLSTRDRRYLMANAVWQHHMSPKDDLPKAKTALALLQKATQQAEKHILIGVMMNYLWCSDAEQVLVDLCRDAGESLDVRRLAAQALLQRCDLNTHMPHAVETILSYGQGLPRCQAFNFTMNQGNRLFSLNEKNRRLVLSAGFGALAELADTELQSGYFVARQLGFILKIGDEFAPDQKARRYQGAHGLKDEFFVDTVRNALQWYAKNKEE